MELLSQNQIIERGWSKAMIQKLLGDPDELRQNPHYKSASPMRMYSIERIQKAEALPEYQAMLEKRQMRGQSAKVVADRKRAELRAEIEGYALSLPSLTLSDLADRAEANYVKHRLEKEEMRAARRGESLREIEFNFTFRPWDEANDFRDRCCVNYLRHCCTNYEDYLSSLTRRIGKAEAYLLLNQRIGELISAQYPVLKGAVVEQLRRKKSGY